MISSLPTPNSEEALIEIGYLVSKELNLLKIIKTLPDLYLDLIRLDIEPGLYEGYLQLMTYDFIIEDHQTKSKTRNIREELNLFIHGLSQDQKAYLLNYYNQRNPLIKLEDDSRDRIHLMIRKVSHQVSINENILPAIIDDISNKKYFIKRPDEYLSEPASHIVLTYSLGMLSRYYPDIWMEAISDIRIAELTNKILNIIYRKFPQLILDQMTLKKHYIHIE